MELRQLRYFIAVAEELHFRRAAARLSISQPPLSSAIKQLESELGTTLFVRNTKMVSLTSAGAAFYPEALKVLAQLELACATTRQVGAGSRGRLRIGFVGGMLLRGIPEAIVHYGRREEGVIVSLREMSSADQIYAITHGQLAAGFLHAGVLPTDLETLVIRTEPFVCCLPADHPLAGNSQLDVRLLAREDMILFARDVSPSYYDSVIALCAAAGFSPRVQHEVTHWLTALVLIARGAGVAVVPDAFANAGLQGVRYVALEDCVTKSIAYFVWKRGSTDPALRGFVDYLHRWCAKNPSPEQVSPPATETRTPRA